MLLLGLLGSLLLTISPTRGQEIPKSETQKSWTGKRRDGQIITQDQPGALHVAERGLPPGLQPLPELQALKAVVSCQWSVVSKKPGGTGVSPVDSAALFKSSFCSRRL
jgi:hypothetical protein